MIYLVYNITRDCLRHYEIHHRVQNMSVNPVRTGFYARISNYIVGWGGVGDRGPAQVHLVDAINLESLSLFLSLSLSSSLSPSLFPSLSLLVCASEYPCRVCESFVFMSRWDGM